MSFLLSLIGLSIFLIPSVKAEEKDYIFNQLTIEEGLSSNKITSFLEDSLGRIWIGTDYGLSVFSGEEVNTFYSDDSIENSIIHNSINVLKKDINSPNIWLGTSSGLCLFDIHTYKSHPIPRSIDKRGVLRRLNIMDIAFDKEGKMWIATANDVFKLDTVLTNITNNSRSFRRYPRYTSFYISPENDIYIGSEEGIYMYNRHIKKTIFLEKTKNINHIKKLFVDSDGDMWVGTSYEGAYLFPDGNLMKKPIAFNTKDKSLMSDLVWDIEEYEIGNVYLVNKEAGIAIYNKTNKKFSYIKADPNKKHALEDKAITSLKKDSRGNLWVGSITSGVSYLDKNRKSFIHYTQGLGESNLFNDNIRCFFEDSKGYIWVGIKQDGGLSRFDLKTKTFKHFPYDKSNPQALQGENVTCINEVDERYLLVGTFLEGLHVLDRRTGIFTQYKPNPDDPHSISHHYIIALTKHPNGKILIGLGSGVDVFDFNNKTFNQIFNEKSGRSIYVENKDSIWLGTQQGLYLLSPEGKIWRIYNQKNYKNNKPYSLKVNFVAEVDMDSNGRLWVGSGNDGLYKISEDRTHFTHYMHKEKNIANRLKAMVIDNNDNIWFSSKEGLSVFYQESETFDYFTMLDGLQSNQFETQAGIKTSQGQLLFGGRNGFNIFHPDSIRKNTTIPNIILTKLKIFNKEILVDDETAILKKQLTFTNEIILNYKQSMISIEYGAISLTSPENNQYAYFMEGVDNDWNYVGNDRTATYVNLHPGDYKFTVKGSNNDGFWNEKGTSLRITILPPWWQRVWFRILVILSVIASIYTFINWRIKSLAKQKIKLRNTVNERTSELYEKTKLLEKQKAELNKTNLELQKLNATKDKLFSIIAHDLRNPLSSILGVSDILNKHYDKYNDDKRHSYIDTIHSSMKTTFQLLENLLFWARSQTKSIKLTLSDISPYQIISSIKELVDNSLEEKNLNLSIKIPKDLSIESDKNMFEAIFRNLITNAIKFSSDGKLEITLKEDKDDITIYVKDCGVGMSQHDIDMLFDNQYNESKAGTKGEMGTGIGLVICNEFISTLHGKLEIESELGLGSTFIVNHPKKQTKE